MMRRIVFIALLLAALALLPMVRAGEEFTASVVRARDGDSIDVRADGQIVRLRLNGIDCPEFRQPRGREAWAFTWERVRGQTVRVRETAQDKYGRTVADVTLPDSSVLNRELVRAGWAWHYKAHSTDADLARLENEARAARRGLWADEAPIAPWVWRHGKSEGEEAENDQAVLRLPE
jgi:endonuclease YncB( thermonuclease family)